MTLGGYFEEDPRWAEEGGGELELYGKPRGL